MSQNSENTNTTTVPLFLFSLFTYSLLSLFLSPPHAYPSLLFSYYIYTYVHLYIQNMYTKPNKHINSTSLPKPSDPRQTKKHRGFDFWTLRFLWSSWLFVSQLLLLWYIIKSSEIFIYLFLLSRCCTSTCNTLLTINYSETMKSKSTLTLLLQITSISHIIAILTSS